MSKLEQGLVAEGLVDPKQARLLDRAKVITRRRAMREAFYYTASLCLITFFGAGLDNFYRYVSKSSLNSPEQERDARIAIGAGLAALALAGAGHSAKRSVEIAENDLVKVVENHAKDSGMPKDRGERIIFNLGLTRYKQGDEESAQKVGF